MEQRVDAEIRAIQEAARRAVEAGGHLPAAAYTDAGYLQHEHAALFLRTWVLAGTASEVPHDGDARPVEIAGRPLVLLRDRGTVRVISNICPHRSACVLDAPVSRAAALTCPYHAWSYRLDGTLRMRPHFHGGGVHDTDPDDPQVRLEPVRSARWNDLVFVNIDGNAPPFEDFITPVAQRYEGYDFSAMKLAGTFELEAPGNWKLVAENYLDNYHIFALHPSIDRSYPQARRHPARLVAPPLILGSYAKDASEDNYMATLPANPGVPAHLRNDNAFFTIFPNVLLHVWSFSVMVMQLVPLSPERTLERYFFYFHAPDGELPADAQPREQAMEAYRAINETEDFPIIPNMQRTRASGGFDQGRLSAFWDGLITDYARLHLDTIERRNR